MGQRLVVSISVVLWILGATVIGLGEFEVLPRGALTAGVGGGIVGLGVALFTQQRRRASANDETLPGRD